MKERYLNTKSSTEILDFVALRGYIQRGWLQHHRFSRYLTALTDKANGIAEADTKKSDTKVLFVKVFA